jgi:hypothetical protein
MLIMDSTLTVPEMQDMEQVAGGWSSARPSMITVDRAWAQELGVAQARGVRRTGNFYKVPRQQYLRLVEASQFRAAAEPCLEWQASDDQAVADLIAGSLKAGVTPPCFEAFVTG